MIHSRNHLGLQEKSPAWAPVAWTVGLVVIVLALLARNAFV